MKRLCLILIIMLGLTTILSAQYNERDILSQQAYQLLARRQFSEAEQLFLQILDKYPDDQMSIQQLLQIYFQTSQLPKAEAMLNEKQRVLPSGLYTEQSILLDIHKGLPLEAMKLAHQYLAQENYDQNKYRLIASYFDSRGFYEQVLQLYDSARTYYHNNDLFILEIANSALNFRQLPRAMDEYLRFIVLNPGNIYFINNQIKTIISEDSTLVDQIRDRTLKTGEPILWELYANTLVELKQYHKALQAYQNLPPTKLYRFAEDQYAALHDEVAALSFAYLDSTATDIGWRADYRLRLAQIDYRNGRTIQAKTILDSLFREPQLNSPAVKNRIQANYVGRKLLADILLSTNAAQDSVLAVLQEARAYGRNQYEIQEADLLIGRFHLMLQEYDKAEAQFKRVTDPAQAEKIEFFRFLAVLTQNQLSLADSLMNEYIIRFPGSSFTNDAIYLMMLVYDLSETGRQSFFDALRAYNLVNKNAPAMLNAVFETNKDEELRLLAIEWALSLGEIDQASALLDYPWEDEVAKEYSTILKLSLSRDSAYEQRFAREYLKENPNSIFSPRLRQIISRMNYSKPNL
ncbi:MAG TPA: hypothetical protein PL124_00750 [Candidatus Cloacimonadota bacterium]|nr:hypothetical protein [Candidatus Cloacimonadota bacterium]